MEFQQYSLGHQQQGSTVEVTLSGTEANVQLVDTANLANYKSGRSFTYYGGHYRSSPIHLAIPYSGTWYVVIDLGGYAGQVRSVVRMLT